MIDEFFKKIRPGYEPVEESVGESLSSFFTDLIGNVNPGGGRYFSYVRERKISETIVSFLTPSDVSRLAKADSDPETIIAMINNGASLKELSFTLG